MPIARVLAVALLLPLAGCLEIGDDGRGGASGTPTTGTPPPTQTPSTPAPPDEAACLRVDVEAAPEEMRPYRQMTLFANVTNCGGSSRDILATERCVGTPHVNFTLWRDGVQVAHLPGGPAIHELPPHDCGDGGQSARVHANETMRRDLRIDGTWVNSPECPPDCNWAQREPLPEGEYVVRASVRIADAGNATGETPIRILAPQVPPLEEGDIEILLDETYDAGETAVVRARNVGDVAYGYRTHYAACDLTYWRDDGTQFIIPPGTHCDIVNSEPIQPGETVALFAWNLTECTRDTWGCAQAAPLPPGTYHIRGVFHPARDDFGVDHTRSTPAGATLRII